MPDIANLELAEQGLNRIEYAWTEMPVLKSIFERFEKEKPLEGLVLAPCLHVTTETANLMRTLKAGGAEIHLCASNPLSTQDDTAAALVKYFDIDVNAVHGADRDLYYKHINTCIDHNPNITMDDGCDLVSTLISDRRDKLENVIGGTEETTTGVIRLRAMARDKVLPVPIIAVNDAQTKHFFDNRYGTGQSTIDGIIRATNILLAGKIFVIAGYGWCGRGLANRARGQGSHVVVTEVEPVKALEAVMDGFVVMPMNEAAPIGDIFCTVTGDINVIRREHMAMMHDGAVLANSGHFDCEIELLALKDMAKEIKRIRPNLDMYVMRDGRKLFLAGEGRLVNLAAAEGHPASVMDMSFANQALCAEYLKDNYKELKAEVYSVPEYIDKRIAEMKLESMKVSIDKLTKEQIEYLSSWKVGT
ncbi:MAG: adenosylhomocysteinase [bacterium]